MNKMMEWMGKIAEKITMLSTTQKIVTAVVAAASLGVVGGGAVLVSSMGSADVTPTEVSQTTEQPGTEFDTEEATEVVKEILVHMETVSIEKDLKIKVVDEEGNIVTDVPFAFSVAQLSVDDEEDEASAAEATKAVAADDMNIEDYDSKTYTDDDMDGIVHIQDLKGGEFLVYMHEAEGFVVEPDTIKTKVKGKIEYKKVDVSNEIKTESQVNTKVEDTAISDVVVEAVVTDTLPLLSTTVTATEVTKDQVDTSDFPQASTNPDYTVEIKGKVTKYCTTHTPGTAVEENRKEPQIGVAGSYDSVVYCTVCKEEISRTTKTIDPLKDPNVPSQTPDKPTTKPDLPSGGTENVPSTEAPGTNVPSTETPSTEVPSTETPGTNVPSTEVPSTETPSTEVPSTEPISTEPVFSEPMGTEVENVQSLSLLSAELPEDALSVRAANNGTGASYVVDATATLGAPYITKVYTHSEESKELTWTLSIEDEQGLIDQKNIVFAVDHTDVANVTQDKSDPTKVTVTGYKAGTANVSITIPYWTVDAAGSKVIAYTTMASVITVDDYSGDQALQIKDKSGNPLYTDSNCTKPATPADYTNASVKLYGEPKYTGWTIIDGKLYYYKGDNTPATGDQIIGGVKYSFNEDGTLREGNQSLGIDVSKWQGSIDWSAVAQSGVKFAIIRCAYRGASTGVIVEDPYFRQNIQGATANGIKVGVYFFTQAINEYEAVEEASTAIGLVSGYSLAYPIFIDTEGATNGRANGLDVATRTAVVKAFCETVRNAGYKPGIYASRSWYNSKLDMSQLSTYNIWVAQYNTTCTYAGRYDIWQYTSSGTIPGINGRVDLDIAYTAY